LVAQAESESVAEDFRKALAATEGLDRAYILRALDFATIAHESQLRADGQPYITHPITVAKLLLGMGMDKYTIAAGLLHDVIEDTSVTVEQLSEKFGGTATNLVQGVTKIGKLHFSTRAEAQVENLRKMLLAMTEDIRVIIIKLADRLHNLRTLGSLPAAKKQRIAQETLEIYAPLAHRLGIATIQWELEDLCFQHLEPEVYVDLIRKVNQQHQEREAFVVKLKAEVEQVVQNAGIECRVSGRPKSFYSIYKKTLKRDKSLSDIYDIIGVRVITKSVSNCYEVLGVLHETWKPLPNRFKDYIAVPKANLYQSLHTTLIHPDGQVFEVQIRTEAMDRVAESGVASHWMYKDGIHDPKKEVQEKLTWLRQILDWHKEVADATDFVDGVKLDLFQNQVYVFTPNGRVVELPAGATPLDFAYAIHTDVGHTCVGAHVNGKLVPFTYELKNGQIVHVITNKNSKGPSRDWLDVVRSTRARTKIKQFLKNEGREEFLGKGKDLVVEEIRKNLRSTSDPNMTPSSVIKSDEFRVAVRNVGFLDVNSFYAAVGRGEHALSSFIKALPLFEEKPVEPTLPQKPASTDSAAVSRGSKGVLVAGMGDMLVRLSKCCNPVVGDSITGYITRGRGVSIHRTDCPNIELLKAEKDREVLVSWDLASLHGKDARFLVEIEVRVYDRPNVLLKVTNVISNFKLNIHAANARVTRQSLGILSFSVEISSMTQLNSLLDQIRSLPDVMSVYRVQPKSKKSTSSSSS